MIRKPVSINQIILILVLALVALMFLLPFYYITVNSFKSFSEIMKDPRAVK